MEIKTVGQFIDLVERMRDAQKAYFMNRHPIKLREARQLETEVDTCIKMRRERGAKQQQPELGATHDTKPE